MLKNIAWEYRRTSRRTNARYFDIGHWFHAVNIVIDALSWISINVYLTQCIHSIYFIMKIEVHCTVSDKNICNVSLIRQLCLRILSALNLNKDIIKFTITVHRISLSTVTIQQICHVVLVSVFQEAFIHPSPTILSEHSIMDTIDHNILMVRICLSHHNVVKAMINRSHWMLYNW